jgi:hypothetical protein
MLPGSTLTDTPPSRIISAAKCTHLSCQLPVNPKPDRDVALIPPAAPAQWQRSRVWAWGRLAREF